MSGTAGTVHLQFNFGEHRGKHQIDDRYLEWVFKVFSEFERWWKPAARRQQQPAHNDVHNFLYRLKSCSRKRDLQEGRQLHRNVVESGNDSNIFVAAALINMYTKCGSMPDAQQVFDSIQQPNVVVWTALILGYADNGQGQSALDFFYRMKTVQQCAPDSVTYLAAIKACTSLAVDEDGSRKGDCLEQGRKIHAEIGCHLTHSLQNTLIYMYFKCGSMKDAKQVFDSIHNPDVVSWNSLIQGYADHDGHAALELFSKMQATARCVPDSVTYVAAIKACTSLAIETGKSECLKRGREIHSKIGNHMDHFLRSALINMYSKCDSMVDARRVFDSVQDPDVVSWNALIMGYADNGQGCAALDLFLKMKDAGRCAPDSVTYIAAIKACTSLVADEDEAGKLEMLKRGREIHSYIGQHMNHLAQSMLINMYAKCGSMVDAQHVFDRIKEPNVVSWTALIMGYADNGQGHSALSLFSRMKVASRCALDSLTYVAAIKACTCIVDDEEAGKGECLKRGRELHSEIGVHMNHFVQNSLIDMYGKCGSMVEAHKVFDSVQESDVVCWNALIMGYADNGQGHAALDMFLRMKAVGCQAPNSVTYAAALKACTSLAESGDEAGKVECLKRGREIHVEIGHHMDRFLHSALINMYSKCGSMADARRVFDCLKKPDVVSWTALIMGYADAGQGHIALDLFSKMKAVGRCSPDSVTYVGAIKACTSLAADRNEAEKGVCLKHGREIHLELGLHMDHSLQNTLINMYAKCGSMVDAKQVFDSIEKPDIVSWTALIVGYQDHGQGHTVLELFSRMKDAGTCTPDSVTYVAALKACGSVGTLAIGRKIHSEITDFNVHVVTCLVDFYAKCGSMVEAVEVFDIHSNTRDITTWTALLAGYGSFGEFDTVFNLFEAMQEEGFQPDAVTFVCVLLCCSQAGLVNKAREYLEAMPMKYGVTPTLMHYNSMVDVLGRANQLDEAVTLLHTMPCMPDLVTWMSLLGACHKWKNVEIGKLAFESVVYLDEKNAAAYALMAQIYGSKGMWEEREGVLETSMKFGARRLPGPTYIMDRIPVL